MPEHATSASVIGGRYLASPAALRSRPQGPVEALDTRSGRTAQVRIVFASDGWDEEGLAESVSRWCAIGCSEICGVLDFGRHEDRWFLVVPPSLGMSVDRWRTTRRPTAADAARLALAFGRLAERIAAAGFPVDAADLSDFSVGPGPTPFLERPLIGAPHLNATLVGPTDGQRTLARLFAASVAGDVPDRLSAWRERAAKGGFPSLAACLDDLEASGASAADRQGMTGTRPMGFDGLFAEDDEAFERRVAPPEPRRWPRRVLGGLGLLAICAVVVGMLVGRAPAATNGPLTAPTPPRPLVADLPPAGAAPKAASKPRGTATPDRAAKRRAQTANSPRRTVRPTPSPQTGTTATPVPSTPAPSAAGSGGSAGSSLPDPGDVGTLPAP
ncbi:MAG: hypothetical protein QOJ13_2962 [Gaiellales bacterium]|jgi:hypothetical protein|nr:hypothetical protein [Gaiellales bacterium]